jgi:hypothetical protein
MTMYYILIDTEKEKIGIRRGNSLDDVNEKFLTEMFFMRTERLNEIGNTDWKEMESKCEQLVSMFDNIGKMRGVF